MAAPPHTEPLPRKRGTSPWGGGSLRSQSVLSSRCASGLCAHVLPPGHVLPHPPMHPTQLSPRALASAVTRHSHCLRQARESGTLPPGSPGTPALRARRAVGAQRVCRPQERTRTDKPSRPSSRPTVPATPGVRRPRARPREAGAPARRQTPLAPEDAPLPCGHSQRCTVSTAGVLLWSARRLSPRAVALAQAVGSHSETGLKWPRSVTPCAQPR